MADISFDDLVPQQSGGMFDDLVPKKNPIAPYTGSKSFGEKISNFLKNVAAVPPPTISGLASGIKAAPQNAAAATFGNMADPATQQAAESVASVAPLGMGAAPGLRIPPLLGKRGASMPNIPTPVEAGAGYKAADAMGVNAPIPDQAAIFLRQGMTKTLDRANVRGERAAEINKALSEEFPETGADAGHLINLERRLRGIGGDAKEILPQVQGAIDQYAPGAMDTIRGANADYNAAKVNQSLDKRFLGKDKAEQLRNAARAELTGPRERFLANEDKTQLEGLMAGSPMQNALLSLSRGLYHLPFGVGATAQLGTRAMANRLALAQAQRAQNAIAMRSPLFRQRLARQLQQQTNAEMGLAARTAGMVGRANIGGLLQPPQPEPLLAQ